MTEFAHTACVLIVMYTKCKHCRIKDTEWGRGRPRHKGRERQQTTHVEKKTCKWLTVQFPRGLRQERLSHMSCGWHTFNWLFHPICKEVAVHKLQHIPILFYETLDILKSCEIKDRAHVIRVLTESHSIFKTNISFSVAIHQCGLCTFNVMLSESFILFSLALSRHLKSALCGYTVYCMYACISALREVELLCEWCSCTLSLLAWR